MGVVPIPHEALVEDLRQVFREYGIDAQVEVVDGELWVITDDERLNVMDRRT